MLVICAVLVPYMSSQKCKFIIFGHTRLLYMCLMAKKVFAGNFSACILSLIMTKINVKHLFEASKVVDKPLNVLN